MDRPALLPWEHPDEVKTIAGRIAAATAREIVERDRREGALLTEVGLAEAHGASRTPAREAMLQLESWGLVRLAPKKGAIVTSVIVEDRRDLLAARTMIEIEAVREVASSELAPEGLAELLEEEVGVQRDAIDRGDAVAFAASDVAFHAAFVAAAGNPVLLEMLTVLGPRMARLTHLAIVESPTRLEVLADEHASLSALALAGEPEAFAAALRAHVARGHGLEVAAASGIDVE